MILPIRPMTAEEQKYTFRSTDRVDTETGAVGYLRIDFGRGGKDFYTTWFDLGGSPKTPAFQAAFDDLINSLRGEGGPLHSMNAMREYCSARPDSAFTVRSQRQFGFRADIGEHACLLRCSPHHGDYNAYCFIYLAQQLNRHMALSQQPPGEAMEPQMEVM